MNLYCWPHHRVHQFTPGEVEQIVYALTGALATESTLEPEPRPGGHDPELICPQIVLEQMAREPEAYLEHVEQGVACRKGAAR